MTKQSTELTKYLDKKWGTRYDFEAPEFLGYGDELGEYYDSFVNAYRSALVCGNEELATMLRQEVLNHHYANVGQLVDEPWIKPHVVLPDELAVSYRRVRAIELGVKKEVSLAMALDWAVLWGKKNEERVWAEREKERLEKRLNELNNKSK